jgi:Tfp pilus assembly protein FimT
MGELLLVLIAVAVIAVIAILALLLWNERRQTAALLDRLRKAQNSAGHLEAVQAQNSQLERTCTVLRDRLRAAAGEANFVQGRLAAMTKQRDEARSYARHYKIRYFEAGGGDEFRSDPEWISP